MVCIWAIIDLLYTYVGTHRQLPIRQVVRCIQSHIVLTVTSYWKLEQILVFCVFLALCGELVEFQ